MLFELTTRIELLLAGARISTTPRPDDGDVALIVHYGVLGIDARSQDDGGAGLARLSPRSGCRGGETRSRALALNLLPGLT